MTIQLKAELRKIDGMRFVRFKVMGQVDTDSIEEAAISAAIQECGIEPGNNVGMFKHLTHAADGEPVSCVGGVDIPIAQIQAFTAALKGRGFEVA